MAEQKYRVLKRLEAGGMAEVYVGEALGVQDFRKRVAIKRVLPHLAKNQDFIEMFLDEARLSARLNHANIVSVFDISAHDDTYFLVMEFVDGANLKRIAESLRTRAQRMRLAEAVYICIEACRGLSYAHELMDEQGAPLGIVHRDISPPNIMVTKRGEVKVADFGLAKAGTQVVSTDPGVVKGKFSYLSPEAAQGAEVDARADIFALGIVLWEMLAGRRLFLGETDYATVKLIQKANIPRLAPLNREVDEQFEEILLRALARDPNARFQSARDFGDALSGYLFTRQLKVTSYDLANLVRTVTSTERTAERQEASLIDKLIQDELDASTAIDSDAPTAEHEGAGAPSAPPRPSLTSMENPETWFDNDADVRSIAPAATPAATAQGASWRESGLPEAAQQAQAAAKPPPPPPQPTSQQGVSAEAAMAAPPPQAAESEQAAATKRGGGPSIAIIVLVFAVILGAAWFVMQR
jgi:serine/threonine-protein kinase